MAFTNNRGRTQTSLAEINVTPLVDVMLVLLVIFMVTAPILQTGIQVNLPKTATSKAENPKSTTVIVSIDKDGNVFISPENKSPLNVQTGEFSRQLKARLDKSQEKKVYVRGDGDTPYRVIAYVLAECKKLEAQVNLVTELDNKKS